MCITVLISRAAIMLNTDRRQARGGDELAELQVAVDAANSTSIARLALLGEAAVDERVQRLGGAINGLEALALTSTRLAKSAASTATR